MGRAFFFFFSRDCADRDWYLPMHLVVSGYCNDFYLFHSEQMSNEPIKKPRAGLV